MDGANAASAASTSRASSLGLRVASVAVLIPLIVGGVYLSAWVVVGLVAVSTVIGILELFGLFRVGGYEPRTAVGLIIGLALCGAAVLQGYLPFDIGLAVVGATLVGSLIAEVARRDHGQGLVNWALTLVGAYYVGGLLLFFILLRRIETPLSGGWLGFLNIAPGAAWIYTVLAITWLQDTAAYFVGRAFGRHKMAPVLSPKKSWEGAIGGFIASILTAMIAVPTLGLPLHLALAALLGALCGVTGPLGDLAESLIKRQVGVKDSGQLIPGHGGILDRADSLFFTVATVYCFVLLTVQI
jgi:phosphatidate cytidylyltransferase